MTKLWKKISAAALAAALMLSCMAGCSGGGTESKKEEGGSAADESMSQGSSDGSAESSQSDDYAEHMTLSIAVWGIGDTIIDGEDEVRDRLYDKFNIDIEPQQISCRTSPRTMLRIPIRSASGAIRVLCVRCRTTGQALKMLRRCWITRRAAP